MPIEQLLALYGYDKARSGGGGGGNGEETEVVPEPRLPDDELEEDMEEDDEEEEEDGEDESLESESSSSDKKVPVAGDSTVNPSEEATLPAKSRGEIRSDLHLLYPTEEGIVPETRLLRSSGVAAVSDEEADEEDDVDYAPGEDEWRKVTH